MRAASAMCSASMPAAASSSSGFPRTASAHGELDDARRLLGVGERGEHGLAEAALRPVVLDGDEAALASPRPRRAALGVERLDRVEVDHPRRDSVLCERIRGGQRLVHGDSGGDDRDLVLVGRPQHAAASDLELLVRSVEDGRRGPQRADVRDPVDVGHGCDELGGLVRVAGVEHDAAVDRAEGGDVLEAHLRRPVLADRDSRVRAARARAARG